MENPNTPSVTRPQIITRARIYAALAALAIILGIRIGQLHLDGDILWHLMDARLILHHGIIHPPPVALLLTRAPPRPRPGARTARTALQKRSGTLKNNMFGQVNIYILYYFLY